MGDFGIELISHNVMYINVMWGQAGGDNIRPSTPRPGFVCLFCGQFANAVLTSGWTGACWRYVKRRGEQKAS